MARQTISNSCIYILPCDEAGKREISKLDVRFTFVAPDYLLCCVSKSRKMKFGKKITLQGLELLGADALCWANSCATLLMANEIANNKEHDEMVLHNMMSDLEKEVKTAQEEKSK